MKIEGHKRNYRIERIERLLSELEYEIVRGMMDGEIEETIQFRFIVPVSKIIPKGVVECRFETRPQLFSMCAPEAKNLRVVK